MLVTFIYNAALRSIIRETRLGKVKGDRVSGADVDVDVDKFSGEVWGTSERQGETARGCATVLVVFRTYCFIWRVLWESVQ